jgi:hypothetical protein
MFPWIPGTPRLMQSSYLSLPSTLDHRQALQYQVALMIIWLQQLEFTNTLGHLVTVGRGKR